MSKLARNLKIAVGTAALACASFSYAGGRVDWSVTVGSGGYGYAPPPAVVYAPPPVVYYRPAPVVEYQTYYYGRPHWEDRDWRWRHEHHHHDHDFRR